jgi:tRNA pseudouridine13 synthase
MTSDLKEAPDEAPNEELPTSLSFNPIYGDFLGCGEIRQTHEDFYVKEILDVEPCGEGEHVYLWVRKAGQNTGWVAEQLAKYLSLRHFDIGYGGMKDRHAVTEQWFSCWLPGKDEPNWEGLAIEGAKVLKSIRHKSKLRRGTHKANQFRLVVRNFNLQNCTRQEFEKRLQQIADTGFPNYFGPQRFGFEGRNLDRARALFRGEKQDRKKRGIYLSSVRSYLFNLQLSDLIEKGIWPLEGAGWLFGLSPHRDIEIPPLDEGLLFWGEGLISSGLKAMQRNWRVLPKDFSWEFGENSLELSFTLPVGAYATSLLHEIINCEGSNK